MTSRCIGNGVRVITIGSGLESNHLLRHGGNIFHLTTQMTSVSTLKGYLSTNSETTSAVTQGMRSQLSSPHFWALSKAKELHYTNKTNANLIKCNLQFSNMSEFIYR